MNEGVTVGSGNIFDDLGLPEGSEKKVKVRLGVAINRAIRERNLKQAEAADLLGTAQSKVSALANYKLSGFSIGRLMEFLTALDRDVDVNITPAHRHGRIAVHELAD
jgi:predicted XRE-type DNA-binding protein